jgi:hypothetical protein
MITTTYAFLQMKCQPTPLKEAQVKNDYNYLCFSANEMSANST